MRHISHCTLCQDLKIFQQTQEYRADYIQLMLMHGRKHLSGNTSGTDTEDDVSDNEQKATARDLRHRAKKKELTMEVYDFILRCYKTDT